MRDKDFKMLIEAYTNVSKKKKIINESSSFCYYYAGEDDGTELPVEIHGKHYKYSGEFKIEASQWTADEHEDYGYNGPYVARYTSHGEAYPEKLEVYDIESLTIYDEEGKEVLVYNANKNNSVTRFNHIGLPTDDILQIVFDNFKHVLDEDSSVIDAVKATAEPPKWEP
jgi:hypothetical protein